MILTGALNRENEVLSFRLADAELEQWMELIRRLALCLTLQSSDSGINRGSEMVNDVQSQFIDPGFLLVNTLTSNTCHMKRLPMLHNRRPSYCCHKENKCAGVSTSEHPKKNSTFTGRKTSAAKPIHATLSTDKTSRRAPRNGYPTHVPPFIQDRDSRI